MFCNCLKDIKHTIENKGEELVITVKGEEKTLKIIEKKLKNLHELCCDDDCC